MPKVARLIIAVLVCFAFFFLALAGCEGDSPPPVKPKVVAKKIQTGGQTGGKIAEKKIEKAQPASKKLNEEVQTPEPVQVRQESIPEKSSGDREKTGQRVVTRKITPPGDMQEKVSGAPLPEEGGKPKKIEPEKESSRRALKPSAGESKMIAGGKIEPAVTRSLPEPAASKSSEEQSVEKVKPVPPAKVPEQDINQKRTARETDKPPRTERMVKPDETESEKVASLSPVPGGTSLGKELSTNDAPFYDPRGKIDPFMPLFRDEPKKEMEEASETGPKKERKKRIPRTPLERLDLSQLNLVGIIRAPGGNKALVEEASGKGYIVSVGTYMGVNGGRVVEITKNRVIVEEEVEDILGKLTMQKREMKIQKPFGEN